MIVGLRRMLIHCALDSDTNAPSTICLFLRHTTIDDSKPWREKYST